MSEFLDESKSKTPKSKSVKVKEVKEPAVMGRPTKYKEEYCNMLIDHMRKGFSFMSFAGVVSVSFECVYEWAREIPNFSEAKKIGHGLQLIYDEIMLDDLSRGTHGKSASAATHIFKMKNCHKWTDKVEVEQTVKTIQINIDKDDADL